MRRLRYCGPGAVLVALEHARIGRRHARGRAALSRFSGRADVVVTELPEKEKTPPMPGGGMGGMGGMDY